MKIQLDYKQDIFKPENEEKVTDTDKVNEQSLLIAGTYGGCVFEYTVEREARSISR